MHESAEDLAALQRLLDESTASAGPHLRAVVTEERRLDAAGLAARLTGLVLLSVATATADGRPLVGPVDGYFLHGAFHFSSGPDAVKIRHLRARPAVSALHLPSEALAVAVHGRAELYEVNDPARPQLRAAMLAHYLPRQGQAFADWLDGADPVGVQIHAEKLFTFHLGG